MSVSFYNSEVLHMVGSGLKKLATAHGMKIDRGVAYGSLGGYAATLTEGSGYKQIIFSVQFPDLANRSKLADYLQTLNLKKQYRVLNLAVESKTVQITFHDTVGTMKKIHAFLDWFIPVLTEYGATSVSICADCGMEISSGKWIMVNGIAYHVHEACAERIQRSVEASNTRKKEEDTGNYLSGALGAFLGAGVGAAVWALVLYMGYVASIVGLLIGWLAEKGYTLLRGKQGKAKVLILILAIIFGVLLGTLAVDVVALAQMINAGELPGFVMADIPAMIWILFTEEPEYRSATITNTLMGLFFAALGVFALLRKTGKEVAGAKYAELK